MSFTNARTQHPQEEALALARSVPLPAIALTLSREQRAARSANALRMGALAFLLCVTLWSALMAKDGDPEAERKMFIALPLIALLAIAAIRFTRPPRPGDAPPPAPPGPAEREIRIEVRESGVTVRRIGEAHEIPYDALAPVWITYSSKHYSHFEGLMIETPIGRVRLDDLWFAGGKAAAAAICQRLDLIGRLPDVPECAHLVRHPNAALS